jgi:hypothetical protein
MFARESVLTKNFRFCLLLLASSGTALTCHKGALSDDAATASAAGLTLGVTTQTCGYPFDSCMTYGYT